MILGILLFILPPSQVIGWYLPGKHTTAELRPQPPHRFSYVKRSLKRVPWVGYIHELGWNIRCKKAELKRYSQKGQLYPSKVNQSKGEPQATGWGACPGQGGPTQHPPHGHDNTKSGWHLPQRIGSILIKSGHTVKQKKRSWEEAGNWKPPAPQALPNKKLLWTILPKEICLLYFLLSLRRDANLKN